jgi:hypothetical protein
MGHLDHIGSEFRDSDFHRASEAVSRGVDFLVEKQLPTGEFATFLGSDRDLAGRIHDSSPFVTAHVLHALHRVERPGIQEVFRRALSYLKSERELGGLWRYYSGSQWKHCRIPPDLDDTACASHALRLHGEAPPRNEWIFRSRRNKEGLYLTWVEPVKKKSPLSRVWWVRSVGEWIAKRKTPPKPESMRSLERFQLESDAVPLTDCDPVVNANVLLYLGDQPDTLPIVAYLKEVIKNGPPEGYSSYYHSPISLFYAISRAHTAGATSLQGLARMILEKTEALQDSNGSWGGPLYTAMGVSVLLTFSGDLTKIEKGIDRLVSCQSEDGSWRAEAFYSGPTEFWGSEELTTATVVEALNRFTNEGDLDR